MPATRTSDLPGRRPRQVGRRSWPIPLALLLLSAVPLIAGTFRMVQLAGGPALIPADHRFDGFPLPLLVHLVAAGTYAVIGAFQLAPGFRRSHLTWHRRAGRVAAATGMLVAGSALWMTLLYATKPGTGLLLYVLRLVFSSAMACCLVLGVTTVRRGDVAAHRAWMIRAYAIALGAGTQAITGGIGAALFGKAPLATDLAMGVAWFINLAVAEWVIRRQPRHRASSRSLSSRASRSAAQVAAPS